MRTTMYTNTFKTFSIQPYSENTWKIGVSLGNLLKICYRTNFNDCGVKLNTFICRFDKNYQF